MFSDTQILKVYSVTSFEEHNSIGEAIDSGYQQMKSDESRRVCDQLGGETIEAVEWSDSIALFRFANGKSMRVFTGPRGVQWAVDESHRLKVPSDVYPRTLLLQYANDPDVVSWRRADILENRVGSSFVRIVRSGHNAFFYAERCAVLLFCVRSIGENGSQELLLSWDDAE